MGRTCWVSTLEVRRRLIPFDQRLVVVDQEVRHELLKFLATVDARSDRETLPLLGGPLLEGHHVVDLALDLAAALDGRWLVA